MPTQLRRDPLVCDELIKEGNVALAEAAALLNNAGIYLENRGQHREAAPLLQDTITIGENMYGRDDPNTYFLLGNLANLYRNQGKYESLAALPA